ncbi:hypothetical protein ACFWY5_29660 [Nonomuraea sp. NPDC059007]|uniref:hypothetical protein n=1 Tax=Nonomuraea sp. NPDC059007 TaxID=3346692 RepID=UPI00369074DE
MKVTDTYADRKITLEMNEQEATDLLAVLTYYPIGNEVRTQKANDAIFNLTSLLDDLRIGLAVRPDYVLELFK